MAVSTTATVNGEVRGTMSRHFEGSGNTVFATTSRTPIVYPDWWGATGNGTTDDTVALQAAFNAGAGNRITISPGNYKTTAVLIIPDHTVVQGSGQSLYGSNGSPTTINATTSGIAFAGTYSTLRDISISGPRSNTAETTSSDPETLQFGTVGVWLSGLSTAYPAAAGTTLENISISNFATGIATSNNSSTGDGGSYIQMNNVRIIRNCVGVAFTGTTTDVRIVNAQVFQNAKHGVYAGVSSYRIIHFVDSLFESNGSVAGISTGLQSSLAGIRTETATTNLHITDSYLEANYVAAGEGTSITFVNSFNSNERYWGPGRIVPNTLFGEQVIDWSPVDDIAGLWSIVGALTATSINTNADPFSTRITSAAVNGTQIAITKTNIDPNVKYLDPIQSTAGATIPAWVQMEFWIKFVSYPPAAGTWGAATSDFEPSITFRDHTGATGFTVDAIDHLDTSSYDFTDAKWHLITMIAPFQYGPAGLVGSVDQAQVQIQFRTAASAQSYAVTPLDVYVKTPVVTVYKLISGAH